MKYKNKCDFNIMAWWGLGGTSLYEIIFEIWASNNLTRRDSSRFSFWTFGWVLLSALLSPGACGDCFHGAAFLDGYKCRQNFRLSNSYLWNRRLDKSLVLSGFALRSTSFLASASAKFCGSVSALSCGSSLASPDSVSGRAIISWCCFGSDFAAFERILKNWNKQGSVLETAQHTLVF